MEAAGENTEQLAGAQAVEGGHSALPACSLLGRNGRKCLNSCEGSRPRTALLQFEPKPCSPGCSVLLARLWGHWVLVGTGSPGLVRGRSSCGRMHLLAPGSRRRESCCPGSTRCPSHAARRGPLKASRRPEGPVCIRARPQPGASSVCRREENGGDGAAVSLLPWLLGCCLGAFCETPRWAKKREVGAQSSAPPTHSPEWAPPARLPAGAAPGGSVDRCCRGVFTPSGSSLSLTAPWAPVSDCSLRVAIHYVGGASGPMRRGDFLGLQFTPVPSQPGEPALAARAAGPAYLWGTAAPADGLCPHGQPRSGRAMGPVAGQRVAKRRGWPQACLSGDPLSP